MNPYENYEAVKAKADLETRRRRERYQRTLRLAVVIMCQQAARNYFLRARADLAGKTIGDTNAKS